MRPPLARPARARAIARKRNPSAERPPNTRPEYFTTPSLPAANLHTAPASGRRRLLGITFAGAPRELRSRWPQATPVAGIARSIANYLAPALGAQSHKRRDGSLTGPVTQELALVAQHLGAQCGPCQRFRAALRIGVELAGDGNRIEWEKFHTLARNGAACSSFQRQGVWRRLELLLKQSLAQVVTRSAAKALQDHYHSQVSAAIEPIASRTARLSARRAASNEFFGRFSGPDKDRKEAPARETSLEKSGRD